MKVKVKSLSCVWLFATPWTAAYQAVPSMGFSRQEYWSALGWEDPLEEGMANHSSILAWRIPWTQELSRGNTSYSVTVGERTA